MKFDDAKTALARTKKQPPGGAALEINKLHRECCAGIRTTLEKAIEIGKRLTVQKKKCGHGQWETWVKANLEFSVSLAWRYMRCHENRANLASVQDLTIADFARFTADPPPTDAPAPSERGRSELLKSPDRSDEAIAEAVDAAISTVAEALMAFGEPQRAQEAAAAEFDGAEPRPRPVAGEFKLVENREPPLPREVDELIWFLESVIPALKKLSVDWSGYAPEDAERLRAVIASIAALAAESPARQPQIFW